MLRALALVFVKGASRPTIDDFCRLYCDFKEAPNITVSVTIRSSENDNLKDLAVVASWITKIDEPWEATLTYSFALPESEQMKFQDAASAIKEADRFWKLVLEYLPHFVTRIYGGNYDSKLRADSDWLDKFSYHMLDAIRDAESQMFSGKNPLLKRALNSFLDNKLRLRGSEEDIETIKQNQRDFESDASALADKLRSRLDLDSVLELANATGATIGGRPTLEGNVDESDFIAALTLMVDSGAFKLPLSQNGLGYNNLIYISLILANLTAEDSLLQGDNAKVFPMLAIEEPEAHLHPAMQYKLLKFLQSIIDREAAGLKNRQLFITTHSTHITSAVSLDNIVCFYSAPNGRVDVAYPGKVFPKTKEGNKSKKYVERYLDATKSNMLFSKGVLLVEGMAEQLLIPRMADYIASDILEDHHVSVVKVDGVGFKHFLPLFGLTTAELQPNTLKRRIACITDSDPCRIKHTKNARKNSCFPFDYSDAGYTFQSKSDNLLNLEALVGASNPYVKLFYCGDKGKTFEYDLALSNPTCQLLITDCCTSKHAEFVKSLMENYKESFQEFLRREATCGFANFFGDRVEQTGWNEVDKKRALVAAHYLESVDNAKGEHAMELNFALHEKHASDDGAFAVPDHIRKAVSWVCES